MSIDTLPIRQLNQHVVREIKAQMARLDVTQEQLAIQLDCSQASISYRLTGKTPLTLDEVEIIAGYLRLPLENLVSRRRRGRMAS